MSCRGNSARNFSLQINAKEDDGKAEVVTFTVEGPYIKSGSGKMQISKPTPQIKLLTPFSASSTRILLSAGSSGSSLDYHELKEQLAAEDGAVVYEQILRNGFSTFFHLHWRVSEEGSLLSLVAVNQVINLNP